MNILLRALIFNDDNSVIDYFKSKYKIFLIYVSVLLAGLMYGRHEFNGQYNWRISIFADAGGYYVYQPALFIYKFDGSKFPDNISTKTGNGFNIDSSGKIVNKYPLGVAILQSPFFLICHLIAHWSGMPTDGFTGIYHHVPDFASWFYTFLALILLFYFLRNFFSYGISLLTVVVVFTGTNLFFYALDYTGMSHIYSFFVFSAFAFLLFNVSPFVNKLSFSRLFILSSLSFLMLVIRPTNIIFLVFILIINFFSQNNELRNLFRNFNLKLIIAALPAGILFFLPQLFYWKYAYGQWIKYSYSGESFSNWNNPQIHKLLFSSDNGLLPHSPLVLFFIAGIFYMIYRKQIKGYLLLILFAVIIYVFSSWHIVSFGCGFGSRNFIEYYVLLAVGFGYLLSELSSFRYYFRKILLSIMVIFIFVGQQLMSNSDKCAFRPEWNYERQWQQLFEFRDKKVFSLKKEQYFNANKEFSKPFVVRQKLHTIENWRYIFIRARVFSEHKPSGVVICCDLKQADSSVFWIGSNPSEIRQIIKGVYEIYMSPLLPAHTKTSQKINIYIWNTQKESFIIRKIKVLFF